MTRDDLLPKEELMEKFFNTANYVVIAAVLVLSASIGVYFWWRGHKDTDDYLLGGRSMSAFPVALSLATSFVSAVTMLGIPSIMYTSGTQYSLVFLSYILQVWIAATFYMPVFVRLRLTSVYEYLELRFNSKFLRSVASVYFVLVMLLYLSVVVYAPSLVLSQVAGTQVHVSCLVLFCVCGFYTCLGGLKAVLWTDAIQFFIMIGVYLALVCIGTTHISGGMNTIFDRNYQSRRIELFNFDPDMRVTFTVWSVIIGNTFTGLHVFAVCQTQVQRYLSCKDESVAKCALYANLVAMTCLLAICVYLGMLIFAFYFDCDPLMAEQVSKADQLIPLFVLQTMGDYPGIPGLLVAGLISGALSTVSSGLNSLATVVVHDGFCSFGYLTSENAGSSRRRLLITRVIALLFCIAIYLLTFIVEHLPSVLKACLSILGLAAGPILGLFSLGMFMPFANRSGAITGFVTGIMLSIWLFIGHEVSVANGYGGCSITRERMPRITDGCPASWNITDPIPTPTECPSWHLPLYDLSFSWPAGIVFVWVMVIGASVSLCTKPQARATLRIELISPAVTSLFCWWPACMRRPFEAYFATIGSSLQIGEWSPSSKRDGDALWS